MRRLTWAPGLVLTAAVAAGGPGCGPDFAPTLAPVGDVSGYVGREITVMLRATSRSPQSLHFDYSAPDISDLKDRPEHPTVASYPDGSAVFRWTPLARDVGTWGFQFVVTDGRTWGRQSARITVDAAGAMGPVFREPVGTGTTLDLQSSSCLHVDVVVDDPQVSGVTIGLGEPMLDGARLTQTDPFGASFQFCPSPEQVAAQDRYTVRFTADDGQSPVAAKPYLLVLLSPPKPDCMGLAPVIMSTPPPDQTTLQNLDVVAQVTDDVGIKGTPLLYTSTQAPSQPPDLGQMTMLEMTKSAGTAQAGTYTGSIPNPVAGSGGSATVYYVIVAQDDDDPQGSCDHTTELGPLSFRVTAGGSQSVPFCGACVADSQCGTGNLCVRLGGSSDGACLADCELGQGCPQGSTCSTSPVTSVGGASRRQCVPDAGSCGGVLPACTDDALEDNDHRLSIANATSHDIPPGDYANLMICPADSVDNDEDWYRMDIASATEIVGRIDFDTNGGDLDLALVNGSGTIVRQSYGVGNSELVRQCVTSPGIYYLHVFSFFPPTQNGYALHVERNVGACCSDDALEPDDDADHAIGTFAAPGAAYTESGLGICSGNDDWFAVTLGSGQRVIVDLTFTQTTAAEDLDVHFYDRDGTTDLTPCPPCDLGNGQGASSNEHFERTVSTGGTYYVVVRGFEGSANSYSIQVQVQ